MPKELARIGVDGTSSLRERLRAGGSSFSFPHMRRIPWLLFVLGLAGFIGSRPGSVREPEIGIPRRRPGEVILPAAAGSLYPSGVPVGTSPGTSRSPGLETELPKVFGGTVFGSPRAFTIRLWNHAGYSSEKRCGCPTGTTLPSGWLMS